MEIHAGAAQQEQIIPVRTQVAHPQPVNFEEVLAVRLPVRADLTQPKHVRVLLVDVGEHLEHHRPPTQDENPQPQVEASSTAATSLLGHEPTGYYRSSIRV